ncbi:MAG TPA: hypothetical protein VLZ50_16355 [Terracidiphilus sp.]|nr:hypothetical protein [Terracidiphilus sp.]
MELRLTDEEHDLLLQFLEERHKHLLHDIAKADHHEFRQGLRDRCTTLERMLEKLRVPVHTAA